MLPNTEQGHVLAPVNQIQMIPSMSANQLEGGLEGTAYGAGPSPLLAFDG